MLTLRGGAGDEKEKELPIDFFHVFEISVE
jgi:hypothetical protein